MAKLLLPVALMMLFFSSCGPSSRQPGDNQANKDSLSAAGKYRYLTIYNTPVEDTIYRDSTLLELNRDQAGNVSGTYRWVLPGKDGKYGKVTGHLSNDTVYGRYAYEQEGGTYHDSIRIVLGEHRAIVTQYNAPASRLTDTLPAWPR